MTKTHFAGIATVALCLQVSLAFAQTEMPAAPATAPEAPAVGQAPPPPAPYTPPAAAPATTAPDAAPAAAPAETSPAAEAAAPAPATSDDAPLNAAQNLTTLIEDVQVVGPWMEGEKSGIWRTVMMQVGTAEKETYRFFIQQIEKAGDTATILSTTEIKEIPGIDGAVVGYRADEPTEGDTTGLTLFFDIVPSDGEIAETYELHFQKDQTYTFGPASN